jgi:hypothetical protein
MTPYGLAHICTVTIWLLWSKIIAPRTGKAYGWKLKDIVQACALKVKRTAVTVHG